MYRQARTGTLCRLLLATAAGWGVGADRTAAATPAEADAAIDRLLDENPKLSELADRDPDLLDLLRNHPSLAGRLATPATWTDRLLKTLTHPWVLFGFGAQLVFMMRFLVQWIASERKRRSYLPVVFWYFSIGGGVMLLTYAIQRRDPVFVLGQSLGLLIYSRNLVLIYRRKAAHRKLVADRAARTVPSPAADFSPRGLESAADSP